MTGSAEVLSPLRTVDKMDSTCAIIVPKVHERGCLVVYRNFRYESIDYLQFSEQEELRICFVENTERLGSATPGRQLLFRAATLVVGDDL